MKFSRFIQWCFFRFSIPLFTAVVAIATVVQVGAFIKSERAIITVSDVHFAKEPVTGLNPLPLFFEMKNSGKSTATVDVLKAAITHGPLPPTPEYGGNPRFTIAPIVPNETSQRILEFSTGWNQETTQEVKAGTRPLVIYGVIEYHDDYSSHWWSFAGNRKTGFCFVYRPTGGVREPVFETCEESAYTYTR
jgi:hypothetical protein